MAEISDLVVIDDNNIARWPEGMAFAQVNNSARADEGLLARWFLDTNGSLITAGTATAYTLTPNRTIAAYYKGLRFTVQFNVACGAAPTITLPGLLAQNLTKQGNAALAANDILTGRIYEIVYDGTQFQVESLSASQLNLLALTIANAGANLLTLNRTENDTVLHKALSIQSGSGSGNDYSINETGDGSNNVATITEQIGSTVIGTKTAVSKGLPLPLDLTEIATPAAPGAGLLRFYASASVSPSKPAYREGASGNEVILSPQAMPSLQGLKISNNAGTPNSKIDVTIALALITNAGIAATGQIAFTTNPASTKTCTFNGTTVTFVTSGATGNQVNIGGSLGATLASLLTLLAGSADVNISQFSYVVSGNNLNMTAQAAGTPGNSLTLATTVAGTTVTGMSGGINPNGTAFLQPVPSTNTINLGTTGANGLDTGTVAASQWYYIFLISNGSAFAALASLAQFPALPSGYTYAYRAGAMQTDGSGNLYRTIQRGKSAQYQITASSNTASFPFIFSNDNTASLWIAKQVTGNGFAFPATAVNGGFVLTCWNGSAQTIMIAPNTAYSAVFGTAPVYMGGYSNGSVAPFYGEMVLESNPIGFWSNTATAGNEVQCVGWIDPVNAC